MSLPGADALVAKAKALVREAKRAGGASSQQDTLELQRTFEALAAAAFRADGWLGSPESMQAIEVLLFLVDEMLAERAASPLCECGVRCAALVLQSVPCGVAHICSQEADPTSACGMRIIDSCLARLVEVCDEAEKQVARATVAPDNEVAAAVHLALACTESIAVSLEKLSPGDDGLLRSQAIWRAALEDTNAIASYLVRAFECACRLFTHCTSAEVRRRPQLAAPAAALYKGAGRVMDHVAAVFSSEAHLCADTGRKRSLMERYCACALAAHQTIMGSPPQFKTVWKALCVVATSFTVASFDGLGMCVKVYSHSCDAVRVLTDQAVALLQRAGDLADAKLQRRVKGLFAFVRFIVFQMPSLLARIRGAVAADDGGEAGVVPGAMAILDTVFGELATEHMRVTMPESLSSMIHQLVATVCTKFAVSLLTSFPQPLLRYLDALQDYRYGPATLHARGPDLPLIEGVRRTSANREILRIATANVGAFAAGCQELLLTHPVPILMALAMSADCDVVSVFAATRDAGAIHSEQCLAAAEYERLASAVAQCAVRVATPELFAHWETAAMQTVCQAPAGSVGAHIVADAWGLLASTAVQPDALLSTVFGVVEAAVAEPQRVSETARRLLCRVVRCFAAKCSGRDLDRSLGDLCRRAVEQSSASRLAQFAGSFAAADWSHPSMAPAAAALQAVFGHLLGEGMAWVVRHQAHVQIIRIATESANQSIAEALVPESQQTSLVRFITRVPGGDEMASADERAAVYRSAFASLCWRAPGPDRIRPSGHPNGHTNGKHVTLPGPAPALLDAIGVLRRQLATAAHSALPASAREAVRAELALLAREMAQFG
ncbi:hypothetical protein IWQ56_000382 [Coemansia nantahalensis]|nr:hypothetical protein IWQ56_000382 [Coemansia nantahalensis]